MKDAIGRGVLICWHCRTAPASADNRPPLGLLGADDADLDDCVLDTGATDNIYNPESELVYVIMSDSNTATIEGIGGDVNTNMVGSVSIPGLDGRKSSLLVPGIATNAAACNRLIYEDGYIFIWSPSFDAILITDTGYIKMDVVNGVPMFPNPERTEEMQQLCDLGYVEEIRKLEKASDTDMNEFNQEFESIMSMYANSTRDITSEEEMTRFMHSETGIQLRERGLQARKKLMQRKKKKNEAGTAKGSNVHDSDATVTTLASPPVQGTGTDAAKSNSSKDVSMQDEDDDDEPPPLVRDDANSDQEEPDNDEELLESIVKKNATGSTEKLTHAAVGYDVRRATKAEKKQAKKLRRRRQVDKLRLETGHKLSQLEGKPPTEHYLTHSPPDMRCHACLTDKQRKAAAQKAAGGDEEESAAEKVPDVLGLVHLDLLTCRRCDINGNRYWLSSKDQKSNYPRGGAIPDKEPTTTWDKTSQLYPGSRLKKEVAENLVETFPRQFAIDGGGEWKGIWDTNVRDRGGIILKSLPGESRTNSRAEHWIGETERQSACSIGHSGAPIPLWSYAAEVFYHNYARVHKNPDGRTPYETMYGKSHQDQLLVFGCEVFYVPDATQRDKFESRSRRAAFVGYAQLGGIYVADLDELREKRLKTILTRNYQANRDIMPMREICRHWDDSDLDSFSLHPASANLLPGSTYEDAAGTRRCSICELVATDAPVDCTYCLKRRRHPRGRPSIGCKRGRCAGHTTSADAKDTGQEEEPANVCAYIQNADVAAAETNTANNAQPVIHPLIPDPNPLAPIHLFGSAIRRGTPSHKAMIGKIKEVIQKINKADERDHNEDKEHYEEVERVRRSFGMISQVHLSTAPAVKDNPDAWAAILTEMNQFKDTGTLRANEVFERDEVTAQDPNALFVEFMMLVGIKHVEDAVRRKWKARGVALGNRLKDKFGKIIHEQLIHCVPAGMEIIRLGFGWSLLTNARGKRGDARGAYLQAKLSGRAVYITIDASLLPAGWDRGEQYRRPVRRVYNSMYGMERGDTDWSRLARKTLVQELHAEWICDFGEESLYMILSEGQEWATLVILYSDDFEIIGPEEDWIYDYLSKRHKFGNTSDQLESNIQEIIGLERSELPKDGDLTQIVVHQAKYATHIVSEYEKTHMNGNALNPVFTPMPLKEKKAEACSYDPLADDNYIEDYTTMQDVDDIMNDPEISKSVPHLYGVKEHLCGEVGWLVRGSRPDLAVAHRRLTSRFTRWTRREDYILHRTYQYIKKTRKLGLLYKATPKDLPNLLTLQRTDADHGDDLADCKSISGGVLKLVGAHGTMITTSWWARKQTTTARNTGHAELTSLDEGTFSFGLPMTGIVETILRRPVRLIAEIDATACLGAVRRGYSRRLSYIKKTERVSISALHEVFYGDCPEQTSRDEYTINRLLHRQSDKNDADLLTKAFTVERHWYLCELIGLRPVP